MTYPKQAVIKPSKIYSYSPLNNNKQEILALLKREGYRIVDFRPPTVDESFVNDGITGIEVEVLHKTWVRAPRFIVVPLPPPNDSQYAPEGWWE